MTKKNGSLQGGPFFFENMNVLCTMWSEVSIVMTFALSNSVFCLKGKHKGKFGRDRSLVSKRLLSLPKQSETSVFLLLEILTEINEEKFVAFDIHQSLRTDIPIANDLQNNLSHIQRGENHLPEYISEDTVPARPQALF